MLVSFMLIFKNILERLTDVIQLSPHGKFFLIGASSFIKVSHSRFSPNIWPSGGYIEVHEQVGDIIDWYNVQVSFF